MEIGDTVYYIDLTYGTEQQMFLEAKVVDIRESAGNVGSRGHKKFIGLSISKEERDRIRGFNLATDMDYMRWAIPQYIESSKISPYHPRLRVDHDNFWKNTL